MAISPPLWKLYEDSPPKLTQPEKALIREYRSLFSRVIEPELIPYSRDFEPEFFAWLDRSSTPR